MFITSLIFIVGVGGIVSVVATGYVLKYSILAIADHGDGTCTSATFKWCWGICVWSASQLAPVAFSVLRSIGNCKKSTEELSPKAIVSKAACTGVFCLVGAIVTNLEFLHGCGDGTDAAMALYAYMWTCYGIVAWLTIAACLIRLESYIETRHVRPPLVYVEEATEP
tara:strand:- start:417 stop:917 length:501 start_codon:yes stop_codon:yes gene_type:complete